MTTVIEANTTIPAKKTQIFSTAVDNQPGVEINVLQGNRSMAKDNKQIGIFHLDGIAPAPAHVPQIEVTFDIDANGILNVTATDKATGKEQHVTIESKGGLTDTEIERMKKEAEEFAEEDKKAKDAADTINLATSTVFQIEKSLEEFKDKVTDDEKTKMNELLDALKKATEEKNVDDIKAKMDALHETWYPIVQRIYQEKQSETEATPETEAKPEN
jgi:molecular chaperone DnaK